MPKSTSHILAVKWQIDNEDTVHQQYTQEMSSSHENFCCKKFEISLADRDVGLSIKPRNSL